MASWEEARQQVQVLVDEPRQARVTVASHSPLGCPPARKSPCQGEEASGPLSGAEHLPVAEQPPSEVLERLRQEVTAAREPGAGAGWSGGG